MVSRNVKPIIGIAGCCARAASGHAAAAPPPSRMTKSRRRIPDTRASPSQSVRRTVSLPPTPWQVLGADLNRWQGARPGLGESLADRGGDSAVAEPSHVRPLACEHAGLSGRGRPRVTRNGGGADSDRGPLDQVEAIEEGRLSSQRIARSICTSRGDVSPGTKGSGRRRG
jgi:hypothetical protein